MTLGRTIKAEITRVRMHRATLLSQETDPPVAAVSARAYFSESKYFCEVFHRYVGVTATAYRRQLRG